jgi:hypothetical protein
MRRWYRTRLEMSLQIASLIPMAQDIREADWKVFRKLHPLALERCCQRVLDEIGRLMNDTSKSSHERYGAVHRLVHDRDRQLAAAFDNPKRSTALLQLARIWADGLLTSAEFAQFSAEARRWVEGLRAL